MPRSRPGMMPPSVALESFLKPSPVPHLSSNEGPRGGSTLRVTIRMECRVAPRRFDGHRPLAHGRKSTLLSHLSVLF